MRWLAGDRHPRFGDPGLDVQRSPLELGGDLVEHWTLAGAERDLVAAKNYDSQIGFALLLKFYGRFGRFPRSRSELDDDAVEFAARQLGAGAGSVGFYEWSGRTFTSSRSNAFPFRLEDKHNAKL